MTARHDILHRIETALIATTDIFEHFTMGYVKAEKKAGGEPVTAADNEVNKLLLELLLRDGEGWLSEETTDNPSRLQKRAVWIVDPLDGTKEFIKGIPEWCVSIGFVEDGRPVAGGIFNPATGETFLGAEGEGVTYNGQPVTLDNKRSLSTASVLASRSEIYRGEWKLFANSDFTIHPMGSIAYKLALVAAGKADITWTITPKNEWDVAAGAALVLAAGGVVYEPNTGTLPSFNSANHLLSGLAAHSKTLLKETRKQIALAMAAAATN